MARAPARRPGAAVPSASMAVVDEPHASEKVGRTLRWLPGVALVRRYQAGWFRYDLTAGLVLTCLLVPAGMAYAEASRLPPVNGLYATFAALVAYFVVGPSRILMVGPDSSLTPVIAATIAPLAVAGSARATDLAAALALLCGGLMLGGALARFGFLTDLLSKPVRYGYLNGIALTILVSQLPKLCGFSTGASDVVEGIRRFVRGVADGEVQVAALAIGVGSIVCLVLLRRLVPQCRARSPSSSGRSASSSPSASTGSRWSATCPVDCPARTSPTCAWATGGGSWGARWGWRSSPSPTPACSRGHWRSEPGRESTRTTSSARSACPTSPPGCSRASRSAAAPPAPRWRNRPGPAPS